MNEIIVGCLEFKCAKRSYLLLILVLCFNWAEVVLTCYWFVFSSDFIKFCLPILLLLVLVNQLNKFSLWLSYLVYKPFQVLLEYDLYIKILLTIPSRNSLPIQKKEEQLEIRKKETEVNNKEGLNKIRNPIMKDLNTIPSHLKPVNPNHLPLLNGLRMYCPAKGNGACSTNCASMHMMEDNSEKAMLQMKSKINHHPV